MSDKKETAASATQEQISKLSACAPFIVESKKLHKICDMCGHANPETASMCKMCSNYLEGDAK